LPRVTVVIPCFNHGRYLDEAVGSALAQTHADLEVVVVDDGSTDPETVALLDHYERPRTRVLRGPNAGPSAARNRGIAEGTGEYVLPLDADDRIAPTYVEKAVRLLDEDPRVGIVYCRAEYFGDRSGPWELPPYGLPRILRENMIFCTALFRRTDWSAVGGFRTLRHGWEDWDFWLSLIERGRDVRLIPEALFTYRIKGASRNADLHAERRKTDETLRGIVTAHLGLYADNVRDIFRERGFLDRREGTAALIAAAALARPWRGFPASPVAALLLLAWALAAPVRRIV
jgi:glycosyltransferase involved in cell wall biosynthesis